MAAKPAPFKAMPTAAMTKMPKASEPKMGNIATTKMTSPSGQNKAAGMASAGTKINPFASKTAGSSFKGGGMAKAKC